MVTVKTLLREKEFSTFRVISGMEGIQNEVCATGFLDWETGDEIREAFGKGSFALMTLAMYRDEPEQAEECIKVMIDNHVAAVAIKDVFFHDVSDELKEYSRSHRVPILLFHQSYINDIMHLIYEKIAEDKNDSVNSSIVETLIKYDSLSEDGRKMFLSQINPLFRIYSMASVFISDENLEHESEYNLRLRYQKLLAALEQINREISESDKIEQSVILYKRGVFVLLMQKEKEEGALQRYLHMLRKKMEKSELFAAYYTGMSQIMPCREIRKILMDGIYANTSGILDKKRVVRSMDMGIDTVIFGNIDNETNVYVENMLAKIREAETNNTPFLKTILTYVDCDGNIEKTAGLLYQHKNTIRYRMDKICKLFGDDNEVVFIGKLFYFTRAYRARMYLENLV